MPLPWRFYTQNTTSPSTLGFAWTCKFSEDSTARNVRYRKKPIVSELVFTVASLTTRYEFLLSGHASSSRVQLSYVLRYTATDRHGSLGMIDCTPPKNLSCSSMSNFTCMLHHWCMECKVRRLRWQLHQTLPAWLKTTPGFAFCVFVQLLDHHVSCVRFFSHQFYSTTNLLSCQLARSHYNYPSYVVEHLRDADCLFCLRRRRLAFSVWL